ncbi:MAG: hypothetical protein FWE77_02820 [Clostridia bacterium]|nr:hypothetical protein [Clostridia bacterium]
MNLADYRVPAIDSMPDIPPLPLPDFARLNREFRQVLMDPANKAFTYNAQTGHPNFAAYLQSDSNEMVTWGILAVGEYLLGRDTRWIAPTFMDFFSEECGLFLNSPGQTSTEHWYMFYVNTLACAVAATLFAGDAAAMARVAASADTLRALARRLRHDFNQQGYHFREKKPFTQKDIYRQPDSIAGYAYAMLFAAERAGRPQYMAECRLAMDRYLAFAGNPWYEIPNGSAGLYTAAYLNAHGQAADVYKAAGWVFDHDEGALQTGRWGSQSIDGLMMGWRGDNRQYALDTAYSMETLMPLQFVLPAVRYAPGLAAAVAKYALNALSSFQLFYGRGTVKLQETKPELPAAVPYEKLAPVPGGEPIAGGDFHGHRSIYGAGYLYWMEAMATRTNEPAIPAFDLSITDWLPEEAYPVYLLRNPHADARAVRFALAPVWRKRRPALTRGGCALWDLADCTQIGKAEDGVSLAAGQVRLAALLPRGVRPAVSGGFVCANQVKLVRCPALMPSSFP